MSLLLEALKKAEKAKEEAQRRARAEAAGELRLEGDGAAEPKSVLTRPQLPEISEPLEILNDDIAPPSNPASAAAAAPAREPEPAKAAQAAPARAQARQVFQAKFREPNPRMPFYLTLGALGLAAASAAAYFWVQLQPPAPLMQARAALPIPVEPLPAAKPLELTRAKPVEAAPAKPVAVVPAKPVPAARTPRPKPAPAATARAAAPASASAAAPRTTEAPRASIGAAGPRVHPKVESGYAAFLAGDLATSRADYQEALREDPANRDALLGLAAIDVRSGRLEAAEATYLRLLQMNPGDAHAHAGLIALRSARLDPLATESRLKSMLAADPAANVLHFTLGNQLAQQGRWTEAQQEYFKAVAAYPDNPDFAYNLAVSLDHLRQPKLALEYYRRALSLGETRGASFDLAAARARVAQLGD